MKILQHAMARELPKGEITSGSKWEIIHGGGIFSGEFGHVIVDRSTKDHVWYHYENEYLNTNFRQGRVAFLEWSNRIE